MSDLITLIKRITKKIKNSSGCSYLYRYFDELIAFLDSIPREKLTEEELDGLADLISDFAYESTYNNFASANWMRYSARSFYCADYLIRYLPDKQQDAQMRYLNLYFLDLMESGVAPIIQQEVFDKYFQANLAQDNKTELYGKMINRAMSECLRCRLRRAEEVTLAHSYTEAADRILRDYITRYNDLSPLRDWIPMFRTQYFADFWYECPGSENYAYSSDYERRVVQKSMDTILDINLKLHYLWYSHNANEMISNLSSDYLIDILEVYEDNEFEKTLRHMASLTFNEKVKQILEHFAHDDDRTVSEMASELLESYKA